MLAYYIPARATVMSSMIEMAMFMGDQGDLSAGDGLHQFVYHGAFYRRLHGFGSG